MKNKMFFFFSEIRQLNLDLVIYKVGDTSLYTQDHDTNPGERASIPSVEVENCKKKCRSV